MQRDRGLEGKESEEEWPKPNLPPSQFLGAGPAQNKYHLNECLSKIEFESPASVEPNTNNTLE